MASQTREWSPTELVTIVAVAIGATLAWSVGVAHAQDRPTGPTVLPVPGAPVATASRDVTAFPGSFWMNTGFASPLEEENLVTNYTFEQGVTWIGHGANRLMPYLSVFGNGDRQGFDWNNRVVMQAGLKLMHRFRTGAVQVTGAYAYETRLKSGLSQRRSLWSANYWFWWDGTPSTRRDNHLFAGFPGSSWGTVGAPSPTERRNVNAIGSVNQGIAVVKFAHLVVIPFVEHTVAADSAQLPWNNRLTRDEGLKLRLPTRGGTVEVSGVYRHERRWLEDRARSGPMASVNLWYGWEPPRQR